MNPDGFDCTKLAEDTIKSVFCVEATPIHQVLDRKERAQAQYNQRVKLVKTKASEQKPIKLPNVQPQVTARETKLGDGPDTRNATGFVIARNESRARILTCAHLIDDCYGPGVSELTVNQVNMLFYFEVTCAHEATKIHKRLGTKDINEESRDKARAYCMALDTQKDLMVLEVDRIVSGSITEGDDTVFFECTEEHPAIQMVKTIPDKLEMCILQGWPPQSMECNSVGHCSFFGRTYSAVTQLNPKGYNMKLVDLSGMVALDGCSGGPIINGNQDCLGVYHGVITHVRGYAISASDVEEFLGKFDMLSWPNDDEVQVDAPMSPGGQAEAEHGEEADVPSHGQGEEVDVPTEGGTRRSKRKRKANVRLGEYM